MLMQIKGVHMNIAYSCAGEGFGHASRLVALYPELARRHTLHLFIPDPVTDFIREKLGHVFITTIPCLEFEKKDNRILFFKTCITGIRRIPKIFLAIQKLSQLLKSMHIDIVISDFDPILPRAAKIAGIPVIQLNHPGIVRRCITWDPRSWFTALAAHILEGPAHKRLYVSFYKGDVGPLVRTRLMEKAVSNNGTIVVSVKGAVRNTVLSVLTAMPGICYELFPKKDGDFDSALAACSCVITTAGHQTISEALVLGKPLLVIPQHAQYEQLLNAKMLAASGRGMYCFIEDFAKVLPRFLSKLARFTGQRQKPAWLITEESYKQLVFLLDRTIAKICKANSQQDTAWYKTINQ